MRTFLLSFCLMIVQHTQLFAHQESRIKGMVVDDQKVAIVGATVYLLTPQHTVLKTALTDENGMYLMMGVPSGKWLIDVSAVGFETRTKEEIEIVSGDFEVPTLVLQRQAKALDVVDVKRELPLIQNLHGKLILNVENSSISAGNNALEIVKRAPGVGVDKDDNLTLMGQVGIAVTIDGRQTYMSGDQLTNLLKSTDGAQIKSVEVNTTRTAKDDAEGAVGTINIVMKKNRLEGFSGSFVASGALGQKLRGNTSLNLNYKKKNTTVFGNYAYTKNNLVEDIGIWRTIANANEVTVFDQTSKMGNVEGFHNYKLGIEQKTSQRNTMLFQVSGRSSMEDNQNISITKMGGERNTVDSLMNTETTNTEKFSQYSFNVNNEFNIDTLGKKLTADLDYSIFRTDNTTGYIYETFLSDLVTYKYDPEKERSLSSTDIDILSAKLDYTQPLVDGVFETGLKYSQVSSDNDILFEYRDAETEEWMNFINRSNIFIYREQIAAGYVDYATNRGKWGIKAGLRGEYTISDGNSRTAERHVKRDYFDLFPSASLSFTAHQNHILALNYSRKVARPNYKHLNPFEYYIDKRSFMKGNPYLNPMYTHGFTLNYTLYQMFNITLGHDRAKDAMVESMGQDVEAKTTWVIRENLGEMQTSYLNLNVPLRIGSFWKMYNNLTGIHMHFKGPVAGYYVDRGSFFFQGSSINNYTLNKALSMELSLNYNSPFLYNLYHIEGRINTDIGATYNFKDKKSSLKLAVTDVFRSNHTNLSTNFEEYNAVIKQYRDSQTVRLTYTLKFGSMKQGPSRKDSQNEEKERAF